MKSAPAGAQDWPSWIDHHSADVAYLGNGVWRAYGTVVLPDAVQPLAKWEVYLQSPDATALFVRVGENSTGDLNNALSHAHAQPDGQALHP